MEHLPENAAPETKRTKLEAGLPHFTGSEQWYKHGQARLTYTDGVRFVAETGGAYWLIDLIASYQAQLRRTRSPLTGQIGVSPQFWLLTVNLEARRGVITCVEDEGQSPLVTQRIPFTDFALPELSLWVEDDVLLLPSEH